MNAKAIVLMNGITWKIDMKNWTIIITAIISITLNSCFGLFDSHSDKIIGNYIVLWIDLQENQTISERSEENSSSSSQLVPEYVFAVGHNDNFIIAKQHPTSGFKNGYKIDTSITNYFVIDMNQKILKTGNKVFGPLTKFQFDSLRRELKINDIKFDMNYPDKY